MKYFNIFKQLVFELFQTNNSTPSSEKGFKKGIIILGLSLFLFCSALYGQDGIVYERSFMHQKLTRYYLLYAPAAYTGQEAWPLVINYHGFSSNAGSQMVKHSKMNAVADTGHFLIAYPQGLVVKDLEAGPSNAGWYIPGSTGASHDDVAFTDSLIDHIDADFNIDLARVHATGWSNGGEFSFYLACKLPDRIASVASVSNAMNDILLDTCQVKRPFSTLLIHGTADPFYPWSGLPGFYSSPPKTVSFWASHNNCSLDSVVTELPDLDATDNSTVTLIQYFNCGDNTETLFYRVNNGGHAWPGTGPSNWGNTNRDINASVEIWNFFKRNPHPNFATGIADKVEYSPETFQLFQNYPNPFNPRTTISYSIPQSGFVELKIFNMLGREIQTLVNEFRQAGRYSFDFDASRLSNGVYFYQLKVGNRFSETKKMLYIK